VRDEIGDRDVVSDALVQHVEITDDRAGVAERVASVPGLTPADVLAASDAPIETVDEVIEELDRHRERWGLTSYVVRANAIASLHEPARAAHASAADHERVGGDIPGDRDERVGGFAWNGMHFAPHALAGARLRRHARTPVRTRRRPPEVPPALRIRRPLRGLTSKVGD
jgi:hypothetical protein